MFDFFSPVMKTISSAGKWMSDNPGATSAIGGAAVAGLDYLQSERQMEADMRAAREERDWRENRSKASSGTDNYGSHYAGLTSGLLVK